MTLHQTSAFEIARLIDLQTDELKIYLIIDPNSRSDNIDDLQAEIEVAGGLPTEVLDVGALTVKDALAQMQSSASPILLILGLGQWTNEHFRQLDLDRSKLDMRCALVFIVDAEGAARFFADAPNVRSLVGASIFVVGKDRFEMSSAKAEERLAQLRTQYNLTDADVIAGAASKSLRIEPEMAEWLVLLGRSSLLGG